MIIIFIALLFLLLSFSLFSFSFAVHGINRLVINAPRTIFEYCVVADDSGDPYYEQEEIKTRYKSYLDEQIYQYVNSYELSFRFYNPNTGGLCMEKCDGVEVKITSDIAFSYSYSRVMFYEISEVNHG